MSRFPWIAKGRQFCIFGDAILDTEARRIAAAAAADAASVQKQSAMELA